MKEYLRKNFSKKGDVLVMMLVLLGAILVTLAATVTFVSRQLRAGTDQEQKERAFHVSEAGLHYVLFLLNDGVYTTEELLTQGQLTHDITYNQQSLGDVTAYISSVSGAQSGEAIQVTSLGRDTSRRSCQDIVAVIGRTQKNFSHPYEIISWDYVPTCP